MAFREDITEKLREVETAKALMTEAMTWSVMKWLREKKRVRKTADQANAALDALSQKTKEMWPVEMQNAYAEMTTRHASKNKSDSRNEPQGTQSKAWALVKDVKDADQEACRARMDAEETFDEAEKKLSTALARDGCRKAIRAWELQQGAIRRAERIWAGV